MVAGAFVVFGLMSMAPAATAGIVQEVVEIPVEVKDIRGRNARQSIKVTVVRDDARAQSGFLILNHGRSSDAAKRAGVSAAAFAANARYFVAQGYAVFIPIRVGYGSSGGPNVENSGPCETKNYVPVYEAGAVQTIKVIEFAKSLPYIDAANGLVAGQSFGGTTAIAIAARNIAGVKGAVNFAGGGGGRPDTHPGQPCSQSRMTELFASFGAASRTPTVWLYSENDQYWGKDIPREWHKAFTGRGGSGPFVPLPPYKADGHPIFTGNPAAWKPAFEDFLRSCCQAAGASATAAPAATTKFGETPEAFTQALAAWARKHLVERAVIVVRRAGRVVHQAAVGGADPAAPVLLASLSKAITGACIATLVRDGRLAFETPLSKALATFFKSHGKPVDLRIERITIAQLLTHRAGFSSASDGDDPATRSLLEAYLASHTPREAPKPAYISAVLGKPLLRDPGQAFAYSNAGYFTLGAVIEEATGQSYDTYCRDKVLAPAGASGALDPTWGVLWSAGGWRMTGADYLAFFEQIDPGRTTFGVATKDWMLDSKDKLFGTAKPQSWYSLGVRMRDQGRGLEFSHTGAWRRRLGPDAQGPRSAETSTLAVRVADGTSWFVHSTPLVLDGARAELDRELLGAYRAVRQWQ